MKKLFILTVCSLVLAVAASEASAQNLQYQPLEPLPGLYQQGQTPTLQNFLSYAFGVLFALGGLVAVLALILGGITFMTSEIADKRAKAKEHIRGALFGLGLLAVSWIILNTINPNLLQFNFNPRAVLQPSSSANKFLDVSIATPSNSTKIYTSNVDAWQAALDKFNQETCNGRGIEQIGNGTDGNGAYTLYRCL